MKYHSFSRQFVVFVALFVFSCANNDPSSVALMPIVYKNLNADAQTNKFTFFSFTTGTLVARADSATTKWDIGFRVTTIIVNGGSSGKGLGKAQVVEGSFDELTTAPLEGYFSDSQTDNRRPVSTSYAIQNGAGKGWYNEDQVTKIVSPIGERFLVFQTADGRYAKMEIQNYYQDSPNPPTATSKDRYYTFRYVFQPNGTVNF